MSRPLKKQNRDGKVAKKASKQKKDSRKNPDFKPIPPNTEPSLTVSDWITFLTADAQDGNQVIIYNSATILSILALLMPLAIFIARTSGWMLALFIILFVLLFVLFVVMLWRLIQSSITFHARVKRTRVLLARIMGKPILTVDEIAKKWTDVLAGLEGKTGVDLFNEEWQNNKKLRKTKGS